MDVDWLRSPHDGIIRIKKRGEFRLDRRSLILLVVAFVAAGNLFHMPVVRAEVPLSPSGMPRPWTGWSELEWNMTSRVAEAGAFEGDLFKASDELGRCPGWFDGLPRFARNFDRLCSRGVFLETAKAKHAEFESCTESFSRADTPTAAMTAVTTCQKVTDALQQVADAAGIVSGSEASDQQAEERRTNLLASVTSYLRDVAACTIKAGITAADMPEARRREWERFVDGARVLETGYELTQTFVSLAEKVATDGPSAFVSNFAPGSIQDWGDALEDAGQWTQGKIAEFFAPFGKAAGQVESLLTSVPAIAESRLMREIEDAKFELDSCEFDRAQADFEVAELKLRASILRHRRDLAFYRHRTMCRWFEIEPRSVVEQEKLLQETYSPYRYWRQSLQTHNRLVDRYVSFRERFRPTGIEERKRSFERMIEEVLGEARRSVERSIASCGAPGGSLPLDTLEQYIWSIRQNADVDHCRGAFEKEADKLIDLADHFFTMGNRAQLVQDELSACRLDSARELIEAEVAALSPGTQSRSELMRTGIESCWNGGPEAMLAQLDRREQSLATALRTVDGLLQQLQRRAIACRGDDSEINLRVEQEIDAMDCPLDHEAVADRRARLEGLNVHLSDPDCVPVQVPAESAVFVIRVSGSGFTPHYAGGSYQLSGHHDVRIVVERDADPLQVIAAFRDRYNTDPCEADIPAIPGLSKIPVLFNGAPGITVRTKPVPGSRLPPSVLLEDTWKASDDDGPSLSELRPDSCP